MHLIGIQGMPRRVADYAEQFADWNLIISLASFGVGLSTLIFLYNMVVSWKGGPRAAANPWRALTLEWQVSSPPPIFNFDSVPTVVGGPYEYGVPGAVHGVFRKGAEVAQPAGASTATAVETGSDTMPTILVVANETVGGAKLLAAVRERAQADPTTRFRLVVPRSRPRSGLVIYDDAVRDAAQVRVDLARSVMAREGLQVEGEVGDPDPFTAAMDAIGDGGDRRDHHLDAARDELGLAEARPHRARARGDRRAGRARRGRPRRRRASGSTSRSSSPTARRATSGCSSG